MRLLVSVTDVADARAAITGGADVIDAKDPARGALGAVSRARLGAIAAEIAGARPLSVALGDVGDGPGEPGMELLAAAAVAVGAEFLKLGFAAGVGANQARTHAMSVAAAVGEHAGRDGRGWASCRLVLAAYADPKPGQLDRDAVLETAAGCGAVGVLLDTQGKHGG